jgi:NADP-dependent 3-hydroxy acid dehydrogenase YdfG
LGAAVLARGDRAILAARRTESLTELSRNYPDTALPVRLDVTDRYSRNEALGAALEHFGRVDVLANIAGRGS